MKCKTFAKYHSGEMGNCCTRCIGKLLQKGVQKEAANLQEVLNLLDVVKGTQSFRKQKRKHKSGSIGAIVKNVQKGDLVSLFRQAGRLKEKGVEVDELKKRYSLTKDQGEILDSFLKRNNLLNSQINAKKPLIDMKKLDRKKLSKVVKEYDKRKKVENNLIKDYINNKISLNDLSNQLNISEDHLKKMLKDRGISTSAFSINNVLDQAKKKIKSFNR